VPCRPFCPMFEIYGIPSTLLNFCLPCSAKFNFEGGHGTFGGDSGEIWAFGHPLGPTQFRPILSLSFFLCLSSWDTSFFREDFCGCDCYSPLGRNKFYYPKPNWEGKRQIAKNVKWGRNGIPPGGRFFVIEAKIRKSEFI
jgi:hypothetical protein